jgi:hypothetical protein
VDVMVRSKAYVSLSVSSGDLLTIPLQMGESGREAG